MTAAGSNLKICQAQSLEEELEESHSMKALAKLKYASTSIYKLVGQEASLMQMVALPTDCQKPAKIFHKWDQKATQNCQETSQESNGPLVKQLTRVARTILYHSVQPNLRSCINNKQWNNKRQFKKKCNHNSSPTSTSCKLSHIKIQCLMATRKFQKIATRAQDHPGTFSFAIKKIAKRAPFIKSVL